MATQLEQVRSAELSERQSCFNGAFATRSNLSKIKIMGATEVAFHKRREIQIEDMASSKRVYRALRALRAAIEGVISFLKRVFGRLERCTGLVQLRAATAMDAGSASAYALDSQAFFAAI